jgi:uncharacterized protein YndB with AHSA1/START domain
VYVSYPGLAMVSGPLVQVCPAAGVNATPERVWSVLAGSTAFASWSGAELVHAEPAGPVVAGQRISLRARALGRWWPVRIDVHEAVPPSRLVVDVRLPFGIVNHETVQIVPEADGRSLVRFN